MQLLRCGTTTFTRVGDTVTDTCAFLGPEGTFTHQAALQAAPQGTPLIPCPDVAAVYDAVNSGKSRWGVVAIESSVEGYVVPSLDALVAATNVIAVAETFVEISFDAFVPAGEVGEATEVVGHPVGLAQCSAYIVERGLVPVAASSNAAACRDIKNHQVALAPPVCSDLYPVHRVAHAVEDFHGARTRFFVITQRDQWTRPGTDLAGDTSMIAITPRATGPGVLARFALAFGQHGLNMSSLITRPLKSLSGKYTFIVTVDSPTSSAPMRAVLQDLMAHDDALKTLGVYFRQGQLDQGIDESKIAPGSVDQTSSSMDAARALLWEGNL